MEDGFGVVVAIVLYVAALYLYFVYVAGFVFALGVLASLCAAAAVVFRVVSEVVEARVQGTRDDGCSGPEPAYKNYWFRSAFLDLNWAVKEAVRLAAMWVESAVTGIHRCFNNEIVFAAWPIGVTLGLALAAGVFMAVVLLIATAAFWLALVSAIAFSAGFVALFFLGIEAVAMLWRRATFVCPHGHCYRRITLPVYICPQCYEQHTRLLPGTYGVFRRRCRCGVLLPTLALFGRRRLEALCPHESCRNRLTPLVGLAPTVHVAVIGAPDAGKTTLMMAWLIQLESESARTSRRMDFPIEADRQMFADGKARFARGELMPKTTERSPTAFLVQLTESNGESHLLYLYDAAGELYGAGAQTVRRTHNYFTYLDAAILVLDPNEIGGGAPQAPQRTETSEAVYARALSSLREMHRGRGTRNSIEVPLAMVVAKGERTELRDVLGREMSRSVETARVTDWLMARGEGNLVRLAANDFAHTSGFVVSAHGRDHAGAGTPFRSEGVLTPLTWALEHRGPKLASAGAQRVAFRGEAASIMVGAGIMTVLAVGTLALAWTGLGLVTPAVSDICGVLANGIVGPLQESLAALEGWMHL